jgi:hypothetical protein
MRNSRGDISRSRLIQTAFLSLAVAVATSCSESGTPPIPENQAAKWRKIAGDGISSAELVLHTWCDEGATFQDVKDSADAGLMAVRAAALKLRSTSMQSGEVEAQQAYEELMRISDLLSVAHHLADHVTKMPDIPPRSSTGGFDSRSPIVRALIYQEAEEQRGEQYRVGDREAHVQAEKSLRAKRIAKVEELLAASRVEAENLGSGSTFVIEGRTVDQAIRCLDSLGRADIDRTRSYE